MNAGNKSWMISPLKVLQSTLRSTRPAILATDIYIRESMGLYIRWRICRWNATDQFAFPNISSKLIVFKVQMNIPQYFPWIFANGSSTDRCGRAEWSECIGLHISRCTSLWPTNSSAEGVEIGSFSHLSQFCGFILYGRACAIETPSLCKICCRCVRFWWILMCIVNDI